MKIVLALLAGAALGVTAVRLRSPSTAPPAVSAGPVDAGPERVAVDVSAFTD
jgi:hypothetical protein